MFPMNEPSVGVLGVPEIAFRLCPSHSKKVAGGFPKPELANMRTLPLGSSVGNIVRSWKLRTSGPLSGGGIVDSGVPGSARASVGTSVEHGAVRSQDRGPYFKCGICLSAACGRGVPELHNRAAGARPRARLRVVDF